MAENSDIVAKQNLLPIGFVEGCCLRCDIVKDGVLDYNEVESPPARLHKQLPTEQNDDFSVTG